MIITKCPLRISLAGGSTDLDVFINQFGYGSVISFPCNLYTYVYIQKDRFGYNHDGYYVVNYSEKEICKDPLDIKNDVVREALKRFKVEPIGITFYSDIYSTGSGLASSSSYMNALVKGLTILTINSKGDHCNYFVSRMAYRIEKKFNYLLGQQDNYGCGIGGLKKMKFYSTKSPQIDFIQTDIFQDTYMYLIPTGVNRKSTSILETIEFKDDRLLKLVTDMEKSLLSNDDQSFHNIIKEGWQKKKETSKYIDQDVSIKNLDKELSVDKNILSHRLCGAGNGGFFLVFTNNKNFDKYNSIPISIDNDGITFKRI